AVEPVQQSYLVDLVGLLRVAAAVQSRPLRAIADEQQGVVDPAHALAVPDLRAVVDDVLIDAFLVGVGAEERWPALLREQQPAPGVKRHVDQRKRPAVVWSFHRLLDAETLRHSEAPFRIDPGA